MKRHLFILGILTSILTLCGLNVKSHESNSVDSVVSITVEPYSGDNEDKLHDNNFSTPDHKAVLDNRTNNYRLCSQRVKRIQPSGNSRLGGSLIKTSFSNNPIALYHNQELVSNLCSLVRQCLTVRYYVFALRHILC